MTNKKKSFLLHIDSLDILDDLTNEQAGLLFKAIKSYQKEDPLKLDQIIKMVFLPFKNQFDRDNEKYLKTCEKRAAAGSKGGKQKVANASKCKQKLANVADSDNKNKNKTNNKSDNDSKYICQLVADVYNEKLPELGKVKVLSDKRKSHIKACIKQFKSSKHDFENIDTWSRLFDYISNSDFLMGTKTEWKASFDFIINKSNLIKIVEGQYDNG